MKNTKFSICHAYVKFFCSIPSHLKLTSSYLRNVQNKRDITSEGGNAKVFIVALNNDWLVGCFGFNGPLRQYFSLYRAVSQREGERGEKG